MSAAARLREALVDQRRRGVPFEDVWERAWTRAVAGASPRTRRDWSEAFEATRGAWEAAYDGGSADGDPRRSPIEDALRNVRELAGLAA